MASTLAYLKELRRRYQNEDDLYYRRFLYFFELIVPDSVAPDKYSNSYFFPLIIPPTSYEMSEPFSVEVTPTQGGGLYVEENGIIQRMIRLSGHTGFKPRPIPTGNNLQVTIPIENSFGRVLKDQVIEAISGQRHFHYLQDKVFRTYGDLKRDPATSKETHLIFHNPKDQEHWIVVPQNFTLRRDASDRVLYNYNIELLVVGVPTGPIAKISEDQSVFDWVKDKVQTLKRVVDAVAGIIQDLSALLGEIKSFINDIATIIDSVTGIMDAVEDFTNGVTTFINHPFSAVESALSRLEEALGIVDKTMETDTSGRSFPETTKNKLNLLTDNLEIIGQYPSLFATPQETAIQEIREQQESRRSITTEEYENAETFGSPTSFEAVRNLGTQLTAGDVRTAQGELTLGGVIRKYRSAVQVTVSEGDTLASIAAKYLGNSRLWQYIAVLNGLKAPFIDQQANAPLVASTSIGSAITGATTGAEESPFGNALGVGSVILVPSNKVSTLGQTALPVLGSKLEEPVENQYLGTDLKLEPVSDVFGSSRTLYDLVIDTDSGSRDVQTISGYENLIQAIVIMLITERGRDILYKGFGTQPVVGLNSSAVDLELVRFRIREALLADPRIAAVQNLTLQQNDDVVDITMDVRVHGFAESQPIRLSL